MRIVVEQKGDPFAHLDEITEIWRELKALEGTRIEIERTLMDIQDRLNRLPEGGLRRGTENIVRYIRERV